MSLMKYFKFLDHIFFFSRSSRISSTQPEPHLHHNNGYDSDGNENVEKENEWTNVCFSQPIHVEDLILSQTQSTPGSSQVCV